MDNIILIFTALGIVVGVAAWMLNKAVKFVIHMYDTGAIQR